KTTSLLLPITLTTLVVRILVILGTLFIILGVLFSVWFAIFLPLILVEGRTGINSLRESSSLTNSQFLRTLAIILYFLLLRFLITPLNTTSLGLILYGVEYLQFGFFTIDPIGFLLGSIIGPIEYTTTTILYLTLVQSKKTK
ncbi:MAG: hypothetical protein ACW976_06975, partial [Candidatus Ranarchaeia archaeon]